MHKKYKLSIPEPCTENWDKMTPNENGRFCLSCSKTVIDFTEMLPEEIQHFFIQNQDQNVCGRIRKSQLDSITIQIPSRILYTQTHYHKMFLLALFIAMGTTLFSCQDKDGNKQKIDEIEVVDNNTKDQIMTTGKTLTPKHASKDTLEDAPPPPLPKVDQTKFVKGKAKIKNAKLAKPVPTNCVETTTNPKAEEQIIMNGGIAIEIAAEFPGGLSKFYTFFTNTFKIPENNIETYNKIRISFVVEKDGSLTYVKPNQIYGESNEKIEPIDEALEKETIRVLQLSPKWVSALYNGKKIRTRFFLPLVIQNNTITMPEPISK